MIPSIEQICEDLAAGRITVQKAVEWMHLHVGMAELRDGFAMAALQGVVPAVEDHISGDTDPLTFARVVSQTSYAIADAMLAERAKA